MQPNTVMKSIKLTDVQIQFAVGLGVIVYASCLLVPWKVDKEQKPVDQVESADTGESIEQKLERAGAEQSIAPKLNCLAEGSLDQSDMCIWVHPTDRAKSTIITSDSKADMLFVYGLDGRVIQSIPTHKPGNVEVRYRFPLGGETVDIVACNGRRDPEILVFKVDAATGQLGRVDHGDIRTTTTGRGLALY